MWIASRPVEVFVAVFTTNLPMIFDTIDGSSGGGGTGARKYYVGGPSSVNPLTILGDDGLEHIVHSISLYELEVFGTSADPEHPRDRVYVFKRVEARNERRVMRD
ncbi:hypothetical protein F5B19DRAFT_449495, partial [Rostrohypoxylon terebratum]